MNKQLSSSNKLVKIRREQRNHELQQLKQSLRFAYNCNEFAKNQIQNQAQYEHLSKEKLFAILREGDLEQLYSVITEADFADEDLLEHFAVEIFDFLEKRFNQPLGVLTLANLMNNFECWAYLAYSRKGIAQLIDCMSRLYPGSQGQRVYCWALCTATERTYVVELEQLGMLMPLLQQILKQLIQNSKDQHFFIQLVKNLSQLKLAFSDDLLIYLCNYFWKVANKATIINIYLMCANLIEQGMFNRSTKVLIHLIVICLRGRTHVNTHLNSYLPHLPKPHALLRVALSEYNKIWESMQTVTDIELEGITIKAGLHSFLLIYEPEMFSKVQSQSDFLQFLLQFCKNGQIRQILNKWMELGALDYLESLLTSNAQICILCLKILKTITYRAMHALERDKSILQMILACNYEKAIMEAMTLFPSTEVSKQSFCVLQMLQQR